MSLGNLVAKIGLDTSALSAQAATVKAELTGIEAQSGTVGSAFSRAGSAIAGSLVPAGAAIGTAGALLTKLGDESLRATAQLKTAIANAGGSFDELSPRIESVSNKLIKFGFDDEATARALATLTTATQDPTKALDSMGLAADIAASRHISLESAADKLAKAYSGNAKVFKEFGIQIKANATEEEKEAALAELQSRVHGQAAAQADNFSTKMESLKIRLENVGEALGQKVGPALAVAGPAMAGVGGIIQSGLVPALISGVGAAASFAAGMIGAAASAVAAAVPVIIAWAPVILAIAAIGAAAYLLYRNWDTVWGAIRDVASTASDWIKTHLEAIALVVLAPLAPLILLAGAFRSHFGEIKDAVLAGVQFIIDTMLGAAEWITKIAAKAFGWVPGIGPKLREAADAVEGFRDDVNAYLDGIRDKDINVNTHYNTFHNDYYGEYQQGSGGRSTAYAEGGLVTKPTFALIGEAGKELVLPLSNMQRTFQLLNQAGLVQPFAMPAPTVASSTTTNANRTVNNYISVDSPDARAIAREIDWHMAV